MGLSLLSAYGGGNLGHSINGRATHAAGCIALTIFNCIPLNASDRATRVTNYVVIRQPIFRVGSSKVEPPPGTVCARVYCTVVKCRTGTRIVPCSHVILLRHKPSAL